MNSIYSSSEANNPINVIKAMINHQLMLMANLPPIVVKLGIVYYCFTSFLAGIFHERGNSWRVSDELLERDSHSRMQGQGDWSWFIAVKMSF